MKDGVPVQFVHIPKAGGSSVTRILTSVARSQGMMTHSNFKVPVNATRGMLLTGHRPLGGGRGDRIKEQNSFYIVAIRNPLDMFVSLYHYKLTDPFGPAARVTPPSPHRFHLHRDSTT